MTQTRVVLRRPTLRVEAEFLRAARRSRRLHGRFARPPLTSRDYAELVKRSRRAAYECHCIADAASGALVGMINLNEIVRGSFQSAYLGYYAFEPHAGRGLMSEGMALVLARAFGELDLHRVEANIQPDNARSIALVKRFGFRREGYSPRYLKLGGRWRDHERWALLCEDWHARAPKRAIGRKRT